MATGSTLPNSKIKLIKTSDVVDVADINAISQAVEQNITSHLAEDVTNKFTLSSSGARSLDAWQIGKLVFVMFYFKPTEVGHRVAVTTTLPAVTTTALSVAATGSRYDVGKIDAYIGQGEIIGVANEGLTTSEVKISGVYLTS